MEFVEHFLPLAHTYGAVLKMAVGHGLPASFARMRNLRAVLRYPRKDDGDVGGIRSDSRYTDSL